RTRRERERREKEPQQAQEAQKESTFVPFVVSSLCLLCSGARSAVLEAETNLSFELAMLRALVLNTAERVHGAVDDQTRIVRQRMVKYIRRIQADLQTLRFRDAHGLAHRAVEGPLSGSRHGLPAESPSLARLRILKDNL